MSRLKQPPNDLPVAPQGEGTSNLFGRYYTLPSPPQETRELKTVNSGTNQGKFTEIQSKEEKKEEEQTTTKQKNKRKSSPTTYNLKAAVAGSRLPREGDSIMSEEEEEEKCKVLKTPATLRSKARDDYEADLQAAD
jgi:hypothetical protein